MSAKFIYTSRGICYLGPQHERNGRYFTGEKPNRDEVELYEYSKLPQAAKVRAK